jgi:NADH:ubiquinone oxidoreductase subunit E
MDEHQVFFGDIWEMILSRKPDVIEKVYASLDPDQRDAVLDHLHKMVTESGWQPEQRISARAALDAIKDLMD